MDGILDSFQSQSKNPDIKHETIWDTCSKSPLNSIPARSKLNSNNAPEGETTTYGNSSAVMMSRGDVLLVDVEIGTKTLENISINCKCLVQDLAKEFADNETIKVVYFLNEKIKKGGNNCDVSEAQVLVKLRPTWKWLPIEELVEDLTMTVEEAFADIPTYFRLMFGLAPKVQRASLAQSSTVLSSSTSSNASHSEDPLAAMMTQLRGVLAKYPVAELFNNDSRQEKKTLPQFTSEKNCCGLSQDKTNELKSLLSGLNTILNTKPQDKPLQQHKSPQKPHTQYHSTHHPEQINQTPTQSTSTENNRLNHCEENRDVAMETISHNKSPAPLSRIRTQFDPNFEVPRLKQWFEENPMPGRRTINDYVSQLNAEQTRQGKQPVTERAVYIWFKNTRARKYKKEPSIG